MRVLFVSHEAPHVRSYGGAIRSNDIWRALSRCAEVKTLVMVDGERTERCPPASADELARIRFARWWSPLEVRRIRSLVASTVENEGFDVAVVRYARLAMLTRHSLATDVIFDADDLAKTAPQMGTHAWQRMGASVRTAARNLFTQLQIPHSAHVWYSNPNDVRRFSARSRSLVPNIVDVPPQLPEIEAPPSPTIIMVAKYGYEPNVEGADFFVKHVFPAVRAAVPGIRLRLVGKCPADLAQAWGSEPAVEVAGFVDDLALEYARAAVVVAPVFSGGGTQIKVIEALAHARGLVVSEFAMSGFVPDVRHGEHALLARNIDEWAAHCIELARNPHKAAALGRAGRNVVAERFSFARMSSEVEATLMTMARWRPAST